MRSKETIGQELTIKRARLAAYRERELTMLSPDGVKSYGIGSRNIQRYDTALKDVQEMIAKLEQEIAELEGLLGGQKPRKAVGVVPRDW
jgi:hypothetical protein